MSLSHRRTGDGSSDHGRFDAGRDRPRDSPSRKAPPLQRNEYFRMSMLPIILSQILFESAGVAGTAGASGRRSGTRHDRQVRATRRVGLRVRCSGGRPPRDAGANRRGRSNRAKSDVRDEPILRGRRSTTARDSRDRSGPPAASVTRFEVARAAADPPIGPAACAPVSKKYSYSRIYTIFIFRAVGARPGSARRIVAPPVPGVGGPVDARRGRGVAVS